MTWINIDIPRKQVTIHSDGCIWEINKRRTRLKGVDELKRDGGWLNQKKIPIEYEHYRKIYCSYCHR